MERRRSLRTAALANRNKVPKSNAEEKKLATKVTAKRKGSVADSGVKASKVAALGDITNRKASTLRGGSLKPSAKRNTKSRGSTTDSDVSTIISSQENSQENSSTSSHILKSQDSNISVLSLNTATSSKTHIAQPSDTTSTSVQSTHTVATSAPTTTLNIPPPDSTQEVALNYVDIDKENSHDIFHSPEYAQDIFNYYKVKETEFLVDDYMVRQTEVTPSMRAVLVDWLVEVQESFELNHETLYLAVRLVDHYLAKHDVTKDALQLVGAAAVFIGCKFDERIPPMVDDFLFICDDAYNRTEFVRMEKEILRTVDFRLGMPISYRFLRRFAKAGKKSMSSLTLARYINETALMSYKIVPFKESLVAAGCLRLAMMMLDPKDEWNSTLQYYSGYSESQLKDIVKLLNQIMHSRNPGLHTIDTKYSHPVFFEVATRPLIPMSLLFRNPSSPSISETISEAIRV